MTGFDSPAPGPATGLRLLLEELAWLGTFAVVAGTAAVIVGDAGDIYVVGDDAYWFSTLGYLAEVLTALAVARWVLLGARRGGQRAKLAIGVVLVASIVVSVVLATRPPVTDIVRWQLEGFPNPQRFPGAQQAQVAVLLLVRTYTGAAILISVSARSLLLLRLHRRAAGSLQ